MITLPDCGLLSFLFCVLNPSLSISQRQYPARAISRSPNRFPCRRSRPTDSPPDPRWCLPIPKMSSDQGGNQSSAGTAGAFADPLGNTC